MAAARVSVVVPTYNRAGLLPETIESVLGQTWRDFELLIVDDGSTDDTASVVRRFNDGRIRYLRQDNRGVAAALNTGWKNAAGEYIAMLGSDDVMLPAQLSTLVPVLDADPLVGLAYGRAQGMGATGKMLPQRLGQPLKFPGHPLKSLLYGDSICGIACGFRRRRIAAVGGFNESLVANEDWDLWIRMAEPAAEPFQITFCDAVLARFRMHEASLTGGRSEHYERVILDRVRLIEAYYARPAVPREALAVKTLALRNVYMDVAIRYLSIGRTERALRYAARAVRAHGNPVAAALRVAGVAAFDLYLSKTEWGVRLVEKIVSRRKRAGE
jgi:glycosyltransferase involved in cell wall biosynthesis